MLSDKENQKIKIKMREKYTMAAKKGTLSIKGNAEVLKCQV